MRIFLKILKWLCPFMLLGGVITAAYFAFTTNYGTKSSEDSFIALSVLLFVFGISIAGFLKKMVIGIATFTKSKSKEFKDEIKEELDKKKKKEAMKILDKEAKHDNHDIQERLPAQSN